ncbi:MAG: 1-deoxy-D-xylulose-5-phosphate reductoisomerase [Bacillota bacterium]|jgi:1-deoxy-D-xylulose-5-phosphate reductoisomerase
MDNRSVAVFGSTGSIGRQTLQVAEHLGVPVVGLIAGNNRQLLEQQIRRFQPQWAVLAAGEGHTEQIGSTKLHFGPGALQHFSREHGADLVVAAISGIAGLLPTWNAVQSGATLALANKEALVTAGQLLISAAEERGVTILPLDSEHSALWQCLGDRPTAAVQRLILTASGGPFRDWPTDRLATVTVDDALAHPTWSMGKKITIDSATLMNKGLEVIEAHWLFGIDYDRIDVVVHPESIVHSLVEFVDGSVLAQLSPPDMRLPIHVAMTYPTRTPGSWPRLQLEQIGALHFQPPRREDFPCLGLAEAAGKAGQSYPIVLNSANEVAVEAFQRGELPFSGIPRLVSEMLARHQPEALCSIDHVLELAGRAEQEAESWLRSRS